MSTPSLWTLTADELLAQTAGPGATPGGGSVAPVAGALGLGLVLMALEISHKRADGPADLASAIAYGQSLLAALRADADADVAVFGQYMAALQLPKATDPEKATRQRAVQAAAVAATEVPLAAAHRLVAALQWAAGVRVHPSVQSDVLAGRDLLLGATHAVLRNVDINLPTIRDGAVQTALVGQATQVRAQLAQMSAALYG